MGFPDTCIALPPDATDDQLVELCNGHTATLRAHIAQVQAQKADDKALTKTRYDGSVQSACRIYQEHPHSKFRKVKHNTRATYLTSLNLIEATVGKRQIRNVNILTCEHWYDEWRKGVVSVGPNGERILGPERIDRAHDAISMFRTVIYFMAALRHPDCKVLAEELARVKFEKGGARTQELTYAHVTAFIRAAMELGRKGIMPAERALTMAIATAGQFELMVRQKDIIGDWAPRNANARFPGGIATIDLDDETWSGFFNWENIPGWIWRMKTSKSKYRAPAEFDLQRYTILYPLLELVPHEQRTGPIIKGEGGLPVRYRSFVKWWRQIADVAQIPSDVESADARAGGATEAEEAGATLEQIQGGLTHTRKETTLGYIRRRTKKIADVAEIRSRSRTSNSDGGTA